MKENGCLNRETDDKRQGVKTLYNNGAELTEEVKQDYLFDMVEYLWGRVLKLGKENSALKLELKEYQNLEQHKVVPEEKIAAGPVHEFEFGVLEEYFLANESLYDSFEKMCPVSVLNEYIESINNIVASVVGNIALARLEQKNGNEILKYLKQAEKACGRTRQLAEKIANLSNRLDSSQLPLFKAPHMYRSVLSKND